MIVYDWAYCKEQFFKLETGSYNKTKFHRTQLKSILRNNKIASTCVQQQQNITYHSSLSYGHTVMQNIIICWYSFLFFKIFKQTN